MVDKYDKSWNLFYNLNKLQTFFSIMRSTASEKVGSRTSKILKLGTSNKFDLDLVSGSINFEWNRRGKWNELDLKRFIITIMNHRLNVRDKFKIMNKQILYISISKIRPYNNKSIQFLRKISKSNEISFINEKPFNFCLLNQENEIKSNIHDNSGVARGNTPNPSPETEKIVVENGVIFQSWIKWQHFRKVAKNLTQVAKNQFSIEIFFENP